MAAILSGLLLGTHYGALAMAVYLLIGAVGVPVFSEFRGGLGHILGPTGGYIVSYPLAAAVAGFAARVVRDAPGRRALATGFFWGTIGLTAIYGVGAAWLSVAAGLHLAVALAQGVVPFVVPDLVKVALAALVAVAAAPAIPFTRA